MAGRKPKPTALKKLEGNPGKRKMNTKEPSMTTKIDSAVMTVLDIKAADCYKG